MPKSERGFTLIELLVSMVLLAVLATISFRATSARAQAYLAVMESDLKNLSLAQELYYEEQAQKPGGPKYASNLTQMDFQLSPNVQLTLAGNAKGWSARANHKDRTDFRCAVFMGDMKAGVHPYEPAIEEGVIVCEPKSGGKKK